MKEFLHRLQRHNNDGLKSSETRENPYFLERYLVYPITDYLHSVYERHLMIQTEEALGTLFTDAFPKDHVPRMLLEDAVYHDPLGLGQRLELYHRLILHFTYTDKRGNVPIQVS